MVAPVAVCLWGDGPAAPQRLLVIALALAAAYGWAAGFGRHSGRSREWWEGAVFALMFAMLLPGPVAWGAAALALSFGTLVGLEMFGGRAVLPPALVGLAFALFSFPDGGFEAHGLDTQSSDPLFALSCLPGAAILLLRGSLAWPIAVGAAAGATATAALLGDPAWWQHPTLGTFAAGVLFVVAAPESAPASRGAQALHGTLAGALIAVLRLADPGHPDGVVFAALLGGLFAPLLERALGWWPRHA